MVNNNLIIESIEILITLLAIAGSHYKGKKDIKEHINTITKDLPKVGTMANIVKTAVNEVAPVVEEVAPAEKNIIENIKNIIESASNCIDQVSSINYQAKQEQLKGLVDEVLKQYNINPTHSEQRLIDEHIISSLNKKINPVG